MKRGPVIITRVIRSAPPRRELGPASDVPWAPAVRRQKPSPGRWIASRISRFRAGDARFWRAALASRRRAVVAACRVPGVLGGRSAVPGDRVCDGPQRLLPPRLLLCALRLCSCSLHWNAPFSLHRVHHPRLNTRHSGHTCISWLALANVKGAPGPRQAPCLGVANFYDAGCAVGEPGECGSAGVRAG